MDTAKSRGAESVEGLDLVIEINSVDSTVDKSIFTSILAPRSHLNLGGFYSQFALLISLLLGSHAP